MLVKAPRLQTADARIQFFVAISRIELGEKANEMISLIVFLCANTGERLFAALEKGTC